MEDLRHKLYPAVQNKVTAIIKKQPLDELTFLLLGFSKTGSQNIAKSKATWQYSYQNIPGGLEYIARYKALFKTYEATDPEKVGLQRGKKIQLNAPLSQSHGCVLHLDEFVRQLPQWPELGYKPRWGKWNTKAELSNSWNGAVLAVLYELKYGKQPHFKGLLEALKSKPFTPTCQFNLCLGEPGPSHDLLTPEAREIQIENFSKGITDPITEKSLETIEPPEEFSITFSDL